jgi:hypothetical protein
MWVDSLTLMTDVLGRPAGTSFGQRLGQEARRYRPPGPNLEGVDRWVLPDVYDPEHEESPDELALWRAAIGDWRQTARLSLIYLVARAIPAVAAAWVAIVVITH